MEEADNILGILKETKKAIEDNDSYKLKLLSDRTIHSATIYQDSDNIIVAVLVYSLGKIIEREGYKKMPGWNKFYSSLVTNLDSGIKSLEDRNFKKFLESLGKIRNSLNELEGSLSIYINDIFHKAEINKAFKLYEHGLSSEKTASLLGVSLWDLAGYMGQSTVSESHFNEAIPIKERVKFAEEFFK